MTPATRQVLTLALTAIVAAGAALGLTSPAPCPECPVCAPPPAVEAPPVVAPVEVAPVTPDAPVAPVEE